MYYILEIQQYLDKSFGYLVHYAEERHRAESKYHEVLAAAAVSGLPKHSAALIDENGNTIMNQTYVHEIVPEEETQEPEPEENPENI